MLTRSAVISGTGPPIAANMWNKRGSRPIFYLSGRAIEIYVLQRHEEVTNFILISRCCDFYHTSVL